MYLQNKYTHIYYCIINRAKSRTLSPEIYTEKHHIIPKSLGGSNSPNNIATLTAKEHAVCHLLLVKMTIGEAKSKMACAAWRMMFSSGKHTRYKITSKMYEAIRVEMAKAASLRSGQYTHSAKAKQKIANSKKGKTRTISPEWRAKIVAAQTGVKRAPCSEERKKKIGDANRGRVRGPMTPEAKQKLSNSKQGKKLHVDPVSGKRYMAYPHQMRE